MRTLVRFLITFLALTGAVALATSQLGVEFGAGNYWDEHGVFFLIFITMFPRLTLLFSSVPFGGILWWLGWIFCPRILVAVLATLGYWHENPILVVASWLVAVGGESSEKYWVVRRSPRFKTSGPDGAKWVKAEISD